MGLDTFKLEVESVVGSETGAVGDKIIYTVNRYNLDKFEERLKRQMKWAVKVDDVTRPASVAGTSFGEAVEITLRREWEGKEILVMAQNFFRDFKESAGQKTKVERFPRTLVKEVSGETEASCGQIVQYRVKSYNRQENNVSKDDRNSVEWAVKVDGKLEELKEKRGESIYLEIKKEWDCKEINVMAYLDSLKEDVCKKTKIKGYYYKGTKQWGILQRDKADEKAKFSATGHKYSLEQMLPDLDEIGKANAKILSMMSLNAVKWVYENIPLVGVRYVLSDDDDIENKVIDNFYTFKYGKKLSFNQNSIQSKKLHNYQPFQDYYKNYLEVIKTMLKEKTLEAKDGDEIDRIFRRSLNTSAFPNFTRISDMYTHDYYGFMGGTQTIKVDLEVKQIGDVSYSVKTRMYIGDWYGADYDDIKGGDISPHFNNTGTHLLDIDDIVFQTGFGTALTVADIWKKRKEI